MTVRASASDLVTLVDEGWRSFRMAVTVLGERALSRPGPDGSTLGAQLAHVAAWEAVTIRRLAAYRSSGSPVPHPDVERFNADVAATASGDPGLLLRELDATHLAFREAVLALDAVQLAAHDGWAAQVVAGNSYDHYPEHKAVLAAARPVTVAALRAAVAAEWRDARVAIRGRGRAGLAAPVVNGGDPVWSYKDLVAHLAGWMELVPRRLAEIRDGTYVSLAGPAGIDAVNARVVADRRLVGPEAILDELDTAYQLVTEALDTLRDGDLADRHVFNVVAFTTYLHFEEHRAELEGGPGA